MALFLGTEDIGRLFDERRIDLAGCVDAVEASFREHGQGEVGVLPRQVLSADGTSPQPRSRALKLSASYMRSSQVMGASVYSTHFRPGDADMWLMVFSGVTGALDGLLHGKVLSLWKTGATAAVAARHLARKAATCAAIIGTGYYAKAQLRCLAVVRDLAEVRCYSRDPARRAAFASWAQTVLPHVRIVDATSAQEAVVDAHIVVTITTSPDPVLFGEWLAPGAHVNAMGQHAPQAREIDTIAVQRSRVFVDAREQALAEKGEILIPLRAGEIHEAHVLGELGEVVAGHIDGRMRDDELTLFCSGGTALEYMGLCRRLIEQARALGLGREID